MAYAARAELAETARAAKDVGTATVVKDVGTATVVKDVEVPVTESQQEAEPVRAQTAGFE